MAMMRSLNRSIYFRSLCSSSAAVNTSNRASAISISPLLLPLFHFLPKPSIPLYLEYIQDLLAPEKINIPIVEDPNTGEVTLPGAVVVKIRDLDHFFQLLQTGVANRHAANTKMNTASSRSHAILMVHVRRAVHVEDSDAPFHEKDGKRDLSNGHGIPTVRKSKLLIVDLAGSERLDESGSEGRLLEEAKALRGHHLL